MDTPEGGSRPAQRPLHGDEADLFREFNPQFVRTVQRRTNAPRDVIDDAYVFAWQQFLQHQPDRGRNWRAWMVKTAEREAWRLNRAEREHASLSIDDLERVGPAEWETADERNHAASGQPSDAPPLARRARNACGASRSGRPPRRTDLGRYPGGV
jgi:hypothetical protein